MTKSLVLHMRHMRIHVVSEHWLVRHENEKYGSKLPNQSTRKSVRQMKPWMMEQGVLRVKTSLKREDKVLYARKQEVHHIKRVNCEAEINGKLKHGSRSLGDI